MKRSLSPLIIGLLVISIVADEGLAADNTRILLGSWSGRATGPQGGPPTGDIVVTFVQGASGITGSIVVKAPGGGQYTGQVSMVSLKNKVFAATAIFKLGENPLETLVSGPLKGKTIQGTFSVSSKGQILGEGTFSITRSAAPSK